MYRQWAQFKLTASIYRYHIAAGAATYFVAPQFTEYLKNQSHYARIQAEKARMQEKGLINTARY